jgi:hypothetical protein
MKSMAPISSAFMVALTSLSVTALTMTTGIELRDMIALSASMPFMTGMSTSSVTTSGLSRSAF